MRRGKVASDLDKLNTELSERVSYFHLVIASEAAKISKDTNKISKDTNKRQRFMMKEMKMERKYKEEARSRSTSNLSSRSSSHSDTDPTDTKQDSPPLHQPRRTRSAKGRFATHNTSPSHNGSLTLRRSATHGLATGTNSTAMPQAQNERKPKELWRSPPGKGNAIQDANQPDTGTDPLYSDSPPPDQILLDQPLLTSTST